MARIDIEIEDYLDEVRTEYLFHEIKKRKDFKDFIKEYIDEEMPKYIIPEFKTSIEILDFIKLVLGLKNGMIKKESLMKLNRYEKVNSYDQRSGEGTIQVPAGYIPGI
jgi:hypothetical protein